MAGIGERYLRRRKSIAESQVQGLLQKVRFCNRLCIFLPIPGPLKELRMCSTTVNAAAVSAQLSAPCSSGNWEISGSFCVILTKGGPVQGNLGMTGMKM